MAGKIDLMKATVNKTALSDVLPMRQQHLAEMNCQIRYNACHERGWTDSWVLCLDDRLVGYGSIKGREIKDRDSVFEFYVLEQYRYRTLQSSLQGTVSSTGPENKGRESGRGFVNATQHRPSLLNPARSP